MALIQKHHLPRTKISNYRRFGQTSTTKMFPLHANPTPTDVGVESATMTDDAEDGPDNPKHGRPTVVLVTGFESFNRNLYQRAADRLPEALAINLEVFADSEIRTGPAGGIADSDNTNPKFVNAMKQADLFIGSLIFDYDDVLAIKKLLPLVRGPRLIFESALEVMEFNRVGTFSMEPPQDGDGSASPPGPPPAVKAVLSKFSSGKEEDRLTGYLKFLKIGPDLLKFVPGDKAGDLRTWLEAYRFWNQGGLSNAAAMFQLLSQRCLMDLTIKRTSQQQKQQHQSIELPQLQVTPDVGLLHPLLDKQRRRRSSSHSASTTTTNLYFTSPKAYLDWRESKACQTLADEFRFQLASTSDAPRVAILLYRKHVITEQKYIYDLIAYMEQLNLLPIPIFINGVEAHTIVRDLLTSQHEIHGVSNGMLLRDSTYNAANAVKVDAIVNTIGFPLVGGPAGSMEAGRNVAVAETLLRNMNVPYIVASPLLLQSLPQWKTNGVLGLQSVVLYSLPELDGAIDTVVLGGLVGDTIALVPERIRKLAGRVQSWIQLRRTPPSQRKLSIVLYGFPPNVGAVGTAALLDVPRSLENLLQRLHDEGYDVGNFIADPNSSGESLVAALSVLSEDPVIAAGASNMEVALNARIKRAKNGDVTTPETLSRPGGGLGGAAVRAFDVTADDLEQTMGKYMSKKVSAAWPEKTERGPGVSAAGNYVVSGIQLGNVWITIQPLLGLEGDPMRLLFERDLTPHPQYCAAYTWMKKESRQDEEDTGGVGSQAVIHLGMHGTVEWLPGQPLGNDRTSWSDELLGSLPNIYIYAANNPSESILAKRRGYGTLVSYNVPPYGRAGLYLELANLKDLVGEYRATAASGDGEGNEERADLRNAIWNSCQRCEIITDVPLLLMDGDDQSSSSVYTDPDLPSSLDDTTFDDWVAKVSDYLAELQDRLFSSGLHTLGSLPSDEDLMSYLRAYFGEKLTEDDCSKAIVAWRKREQEARSKAESNVFQGIVSWLKDLANDSSSSSSSSPAATDHSDGSHSSILSLMNEATDIASLLGRSTEELDNIINALDGGYVPPAPGGDLLRDGTSVLPTGRNIHALDPYRMPSASAWIRGQRAAEEILRQHQLANDGAYPETVAVTLWGLDTIKTRGESIAIVLALVGAEPVKEGTGRVVRFDLIPLEQLGRPRVDVLASLSGIFRDSFANVVDLLDDMFERAATAENEPEEMNFIKKHAEELKASGVTERSAARLFSNPPGDYGSMVNEVVGSGDWSESESLGETWKGRNVFSYGRNEGDNEGASAGTARPEVLDKLLSTTERVVQEIDSVEYGLTDIQEYYANTGALKKAAENRKPIDGKTGKRKKVALSVIEAFGGGTSEDAKVPVRDLEEVLRLEYRSKLLNPKWRDAMLEQGSGGAFEVSQRMTAMVGWAATADVDNFVFDQAAERYALDEDVAKQLQRSNPEAFKNVVRRLLEAAGRGMWETDDDTLEKLRDLYSDADDLVEQVGASFANDN